MQSYLEKRYIVWRPVHERADVPVSLILSEFPDVRILKARDPDHAVVLMNPVTKQMLSERFPDLLVEIDAQHRLVLVA